MLFLWHITMDSHVLSTLAALYVEAAVDRKDYMREYMKNRYHEKRNAIISELGGKCVSCGDTDHLHIDHIDADKKTFRASDIHSVSDAKAKKEKENFQLLCETCHKKKTHDAWDYSTPKPTHGTYWNFRAHGCRCDDCTKAYKSTIKDWKEKAKNKLRGEK